MGSKRGLTIETPDRVSRDVDTAAALAARGALPPEPDHPPLAELLDDSDHPTQQRRKDDTR